MWLLDQNGQSINVEGADPRQVLAGIQQGALQVEKNIAYQLVNPEDGAMYNVAGEDLQTALSKGWTPETTAERGKREKRAGELETLQRYGGGAYAASAGALRGLSFGLSDFISTKLDPNSEVALRTAKVEMPGISAASELGGVALGLVGGFATPVGALSSGLSKGVQAVTRGLEAANLSKGAAGAIAAGLRIAAAGTEGAVYGAGQTLTEASLGDPDEAADHLLHNVGFGALLGAGTAGVLEGAFGLAKLGAKGVRSVSRALTEAAGGEPGFAGGVAKMIGAEDAVAVAQFANDFDVQASKLIAETDDALQVSMSKTVEPLRRRSMVGGKIDQFANAAPNRPVKDVVDDAVAHVEELFGGVDSALKTEGVAFKQSYQSYIKQGFSENEARKLATAVQKGTGGFRFAKQNKIREAHARINEAIDRLRAFDTSNGPRANAEVFGALDKLKTRLDNIVDDFKAYKFGGVDAAESVAGGEFMANTFNLLRDTRNKLQGFLEDTSVWGEMAGLQASINEPFSAMLGTSSPKLASQRLLDEFTKVYKAEPNAFRKMVQNAVNGDDTALSMFMARLDEMERLAKVLDDSFVWPNGSPSADVLKQAPKIRALVDDFRGKLELRSNVDQIMANEAAGGTGLPWAAGVAGYAVGGPAGAAGAAGLATAMTKPYRTAQQLYALQQSLAGAVERNSRSLRIVSEALFEGVGKAKVLPGLGAVATEIGNESDTEAVTKYLEKIEADPEAFLNDVQALVQPVGEVAPDVASAAGQKVTNLTAALLKLKRDADAPMGGEMMPGLTTTGQDPAAKLRYITAVRYSLNPDLYLNDVASGRAGPMHHALYNMLNPGGANRLREYMAISVADRAAQKVNMLLPYSSRVMMSEIMQSPLDQTLQPSTVKYLQSNYSQSNGKNGPGLTNQLQHGFPVQGVGDVNADQNMSTQDQHLQRRIGNG